MSFTEKFAETRNNLRNLRKAIPDTFAGFVTMEKAASADGVLSHKEKELIALGIAVALRGLHHQPCRRLPPRRRHARGNGRGPRHRHPDVGRTGPDVCLQSPCRL